MKRSFQLFFLALMVGAAIGIPNLPVSKVRAESGSKVPVTGEDVVRVQVVRISGTIDGSGRIVFRQGKAHYEHKHWGFPESVKFDNEPWTVLSRTPLSWGDYSHALDLTKARIIKRTGRDTIALETNPDGFDLFLCDSPSGANHYEVDIAIPKRSN